MKKLILLGLMLLQISVYADTTNTSATNAIEIGEVERIVDKYADKFTDALKGLAAALEVPAKHVYAILVKQQMVYAIGYLILIIAGIFIVGSCIGLASYADSNNYEFLCVSSFIFGVVGAIMLIVGMCLIPEILTGFVNPEYGAIKDIANLIK